ncbi:MAG: hypothetical protein MMC23_005575 [Stictis urceolatum]|nr:hypothetical protein [Stictis urceolata]
MKFSATLISSLLLATSAVAAPGNFRNRRRSGRHISVPYKGGNQTSEATEAHSYDSNWAGAAWASPPSGSKFTSVTGTFNVPTLKSVGSDSSGSAWVGIDGYNTNSILQTGIQWEVTSSGQTSYSAWHEWYPAVSINFPSLPMSPGDEIQVSVVAKTSTSGTATVKNTSTGKSVTASISGQALAAKNAEWIVEDFEEGSSLVPFANFGKVTFTSSSATTDAGTVGVSGADTVDIEQNGKVLTSSTTSANGAVIQYE